MAKAAVDTAPPTSRKSVAVMISGRGSNLGALIAATMAPDYPALITRVIADRADAGGLEIAAKQDIETVVVPFADFDDREAHEAAVMEALEQADFICLAGYMRILSPAFTERFRGHMLNIHPSLLPSFKGRQTHQRALTAGIRLHGATVHFVNEELDGGPIIAQAAVPVLPGDDEASLAERVLAAEHRLYPHALKLVASGQARLSGHGVVFANTKDAADDSMIVAPPLDG